MSYFKRLLLLGGIGMLVLTGLMFASNTNVSTAHASGCTTVAQGYSNDGLGNYYPNWSNTCTVSQGNSSNAVRAIQYFINNYGGYDPQTRNPCYTGNIDGIFGQSTFNGVVCFQKWYNQGASQKISVDGIVGPQTWGAMSSTWPFVGATKINTTGWNYFSTYDFRMWGQSPYKWYVNPGDCWRQISVNSNSCE